jgi:hypothetical protein
VTSRILLTLAMVAPAIAHADTVEPVPDVRVAITPPPSRRLAIELEPVPFIADLGKLSADLVLVPIDHHALVVSPFYTSTTTAPIVIPDANGNPMLQLPEQIFHGVGIELGYRYYRGLGGPRGFFVGPSFIFVEMNEKQGQFGDGSHTSYRDLGVALDVGYQVLVADRLSLALGAGVQGLVTSKSIPEQQFPAKMYANSGVWPRLVLAIGWAL